MFTVVDSKRWIERFLNKAFCLLAFAVLLLSCDEEVAKNEVVPDLDMFTVTFDAGAGYRIAPQKIKKGGKVHRLTLDVPKEGHTFDLSKPRYKLEGWYRNKEKTEAFDFGVSVLSDIVIYAKWRLISVQVRFSANDGSGVAFSSQTLGYKKKVSRPTPSPTREGYTFADWYEDEAGIEVFDFDKLMVSDATIYAKWNPIPYQVRYRVNDGSGVVFLSQTVHYAETPTLPTPPTREGYTFVGWYEDEGGNRAFDFEQPIVGDVVAYADWEVSLPKVNRLQVTVKGVDYDGVIEGNQLLVNMGTEYVNINEVQNVVLKSLALPVGTTSTPAEGDQLSVQRGKGLLTVNSVGVSQDYHLRLFVKPQALDQLKAIVREAIGEEGDRVDLNFIETSLIKDMRELFRNASSFNGELSAWDVSSVTDMNNMFAGATSFNGDVSGWDVSSVTNMIGMFVDATVFDGDVLGWDVSSVTDMRYMFFRATSFNGDLSNWDVSSVTNMNEMFHRAAVFNGDVSDWDVSSVTSMDYMFSSATLFNGELSGWDVSNVTSMEGMFYIATSFNVNLSGWDVSNVPFTYQMFYGASSLTKANRPRWYSGPW